MARAEKRAWQRMLSGRRLDLLNPSALDIELGDIAHGLARVARWNGQTIGDYPFSVAQHSILVVEIFKATSKKASPADLLYALFHDGAEYVMGDLISPFKAAIGGDYTNIEDSILQAIHLRFSLPAKCPLATKRNIKKADRQAAYFEAVNLAGFAREEAGKLFGEPTIANFDLDGFESFIRPWPTREAQEQFEKLYLKISSQINA